MLGIMIAQQIRFNTIDVFQKCFLCPESYPVQQLFPLLFANFKDAIYNSWSAQWDLKEKINGKDYEKKKVKLGKPSTV